MNTTAEQPIKCTPTSSLLGNSSPEILKPIQIPAGTLQVAWIEQIDAHGLFLTDEHGTSVIAAHHNGFSCYALARCIRDKDEDRALRQLQFIRDCGGLVRNEGAVQWLINPSED